MEQEKIKNLEKSIDNMKNKLSKIFFVVQDTKGNPKASVRYIYQMALALKKNGYSPVILHEKPDYTGVASWLDETYMNELEHRPIEGQNLEVSPEDIIVVPELYGFILEQITKLTCGKVILCQSYDWMLETLQPGQTWQQFGITKCITTTEDQKEYISHVMRNTSFDIIPPVISDCFKKQFYPPKPIVAIHSRDQRDSLNLIKTFYLKYPQYRWITFRDMRGLSEQDFAKALQDAFVSVWIDPSSSFGTYPLECMKVGVPVIGVTPRLKHSWVNENNGIWIPNQAQLVDYIADFIQNWIEDNINPELYELAEKEAEKYSDLNIFEELVVTTFQSYIQQRSDAFEEQLNKLSETVEQ